MHAAAHAHAQSAWCRSDPAPWRARAGGKAGKQRSRPGKPSDAAIVLQRRLMQVGGRLRWRSWAVLCAEAAQAARLLQLSLPSSL